MMIRHMVLKNYYTIFKRNVCVMEFLIMPKLEFGAPRCRVQSFFLWRYKRICLTMGEYDSLKRRRRSTMCEYSVMKGREFRRRRGREGDSGKEGKLDGVKQLSNTRFKCPLK